MEAGITDRKSYDEISPEVEYVLTEKGKSVIPILQGIVSGRAFFKKKIVTIRRHSARNVIIVSKENDVYEKDVF